MQMVTKKECFDLFLLSVFNHTERTVTIHAVDTVTTETVTDITEVVLLVVQAGVMGNGAIKVNINQILKGLKTFTNKS